MTLFVNRRFKENEKVVAFVSLELWVTETNDFTIKIFIAKRGSILSSPLFMSKKNAFMLDFVNINRTFACVAKKNIQKTYKIR